VREQRMRELFDDLTQLRGRVRHPPSHALKLDDDTVGVLLPPWSPTYNMSMSTIIQPCNASGPFDTDFGSRFGRYRSSQYLRWDYIQCLLTLVLALSIYRIRRYRGLRF
jgi:hypothetical protein